MVRRREKEGRRAGKRRIGEERREGRRKGKKEGEEERREERREDPEPTYSLHASCWQVMRRSRAKRKSFHTHPDCVRLCGAVRRERCVDMWDGSGEESGSGWAGRGGEATNFGWEHLQLIV